MCFEKIYYVGNDMVEATKQKAMTDIICYKKLLNINGKIYSPVKDFCYILNKKYRIWFWGFKDKRHHDTDFINVGFHSYQQIKDAEHYYYRKDMLLLSITYKCIIPKGAYYFKNNNEYVSNQIIIKEQI